MVTAVKNDDGELKAEAVLLTFHRGDDKNEFLEKWKEAIEFVEV